MIAGDKTNLDSLPDPDILANEIVENIEAALEGFREIADIVNGNGEKCMKQENM